MADVDATESTAEQEHRIHECWAHGGTQVSFERPVPELSVDVVLQARSHVSSDEATGHRDMFLMW